MRVEQNMDSEMGFLNLMVFGLVWFQRFEEGERE